MAQRRLAFWLSAAALVLAAIWPATATPQNAGASEYQVKAAFLYNFAKYVEWPPEASGTAVTLCIGGRDPFGPALATFEGRNMNGREFRVRRNLSPDDTRGCQLLFLPEGEERRVAAWLRSASISGSLAVSDLEGFGDAGGAIAMVTADNRVQFDVNMIPVNRAGLRINAQLLKLARQVVGIKGK